MYRVEREYIEHRALVPFNQTMPGLPAGTSTGGGLGVV
jgi:hypothetical protein